MACPPGTIMNPRTLRCVKITGRRARQLAAAGIVGDADVAYVAPGTRVPALAPVPWRQAMAPPQPPAALWWPAPRRRLTQRRPLWAPAPAPAPPTCTSDQVINPATGRCVKLAGRVFKRLRAAAAPVPRLAPPPRAPAARRTLSAHPLGRAAVAPLADRTGILEWTAANCRNAVDPLTSTAFVSADTTALQELIQLHDRTCTLATPLDRAVAAAHAAGRTATVPGDPSTPLTLDDFKALRAARRRRDPAYRLPARRHAPPPATWQLYIGSDARSGPQFATVAYVEPAKARRTPFGIEYPPAAYRADLGFIPTTAPAGATCSSQQVVDLLERLARANRLLVPVAGGWRPLPGMGFPLTKLYWETDRAGRLSALCNKLAAALENPI